MGINCMRAHVQEPPGGLGGAGGGRRRAAARQLAGGARGTLNPPPQTPALVCCGGLPAHTPLHAAACRGYWSARSASSPRSPQASLGVPPPSPPCKRPFKSAKFPQP